MGRDDDQRGESAEMNYFFTNHLCVNSKDKSNLGQKTKSDGRNTEVASWGQKYREFNQFHVFSFKDQLIPRVLF